MRRASAFLIMCACLSGGCCREAAELPEVLPVPVVRCPRPEPPVLPAYPEGAHIGSAQGAAWLMEAVDAAAAYARALDSALKCYEAQARDTQAAPHD